MSANDNSTGRDIPMYPRKELERLLTPRRVNFPVARLASMYIFVGTG